MVSHSPLEQNVSKEAHPTSVDTSALTSASALDQALRARLDDALMEERNGAEHFDSSRPILIASAVWFAIGAVVWIIGLALWG
jgi:hypothetical protein